MTGKSWSWRASGMPGWSSINTTTWCGPGGMSGGTCTVSVPSAVIVAVVSIVRIGRSPVSMLGAGARRRQRAQSALVAAAELALQRTGGRVGRGPPHRPWPATAVARARHLQSCAPHCQSRMGERNNGSLLRLLLASRGLFPPGGRSCVGAFPWVSGPVAGRLLLPLRDLGKGDHLRRSLAVKPLHVALGNELREREFPGLLPMGGKPAEFLRVQTELTRHLDMQIAQVQPPLGFRPGVEAGFGLLHDVSFPLQACGRDAQRAGADTGIRHQTCRAPRTPRGPDAPLPAV